MGGQAQSADRVRAPGAHIVRRPGTLRRYLQRIDLLGRLPRTLGVLSSDYGSARLSLTQLQGLTSTWTD